MKAPEHKTRGKGKGHLWRLHDGRATSTIVLNLDTRDPVAAKRLDDLYFTIFNLRRATQRDAQNICRVYREHRGDVQKRGYLVVAEELGLTRKAFENRAREHYRAMGWASDHVSAALVNHMADAVFENATRHLHADVSGRRHGPLRLTTYHEFSTIHGRARSHTKVNKWETFRLYGTLQGHLDAYGHPHLDEYVTVDEISQLGPGHSVFRQRRCAPPAPQRWSQHAGPLVMVFAGGPHSTKGELVVPVLLPTGSGQWARLVHFLGDPSTWHKIDLVRRPDASCEHGWRYEIHLLVLRQGYHSPAVREQLARAPKNRVACVDVNVSNLSVVSQGQGVTDLKSTQVRVTDLERDRVERVEAKKRRGQRRADRSRRASNAAQYQKSQAQRARDERRAARGLRPLKDLTPAGARIAMSNGRPVRGYHRDQLSSAYRTTRTRLGEACAAISITKHQAARTIATELVATHGINWVIEDCHLGAWFKLWGKAMAITAPGMVTSELEVLVTSLGGGFTKFSTATTALSSHCLCGHGSKKSLATRTHFCKACGLRGDRDLVAAALGTCVVPGSAMSPDLVDYDQARTLAALLSLTTRCEDTLSSQTHPLKVGRHGDLQGARSDPRGPDCSAQYRSTATSTKGRARVRSAKVAHDNGSRTGPSDPLRVNS